MWSKSVKQFWLQFLELYKSHACLWDVDSVEYLNKSKRKVAYAELIQLAKKINSDANHEFIRSRINNLRTAYRKEVKKVLIAREKGKVFKPKLFYYDLLNSFLKRDNSLEYDLKNTHSDNTSDEEDPFAALESPIANNDSQSNTNNIQYADDTNLDSGEKNDSYHTKIEPDHSETNSYSRRGTKRALLESDHDYHNAGSLNRLQLSRGEKRPLKYLKRSNIEHYEEIDDSESEEDFVRKKRRVTDDECGILGRRFATHFRNMKPQQRLLAEKIISDVCIYARMDQLTLRSGLTIDLPHDFNNFTQQRSVSYREEGIHDEEVDLSPEAYIQAV